MGEFKVESPDLVFDSGPSTTALLEALQSERQRLVLDIVAQLRKCGLERELEIPQIVVCGEQSAGKSSVLEAVTGIPFPRNDELCTRFVTEIIMRRSTTESLTIGIIPDNGRPQEEVDAIRAFNEVLLDFDDLPMVIDRATKVMGIGSSEHHSHAFTKDVLSIEIEGPNRPQLTLIDLPGLIQNETKGVGAHDVELVREITEKYISQSRTICLAVVSATHDYATQDILTKVRKVDPEGKRTLGIITKPDRLPAGSGSERAFLKLARNEDIFFDLGWHVVKSRNFEERNCSLIERDASEASYFLHSNFNCLPEDTVGIASLRTRLSVLLFEHIKREFPKLNDELDRILNDSEQQLSILGEPRSSSEECRECLMKISLDFHKVCNAAVKGQYEGPFFKYNSIETFTIESPGALRRLRAMVQRYNVQFAKNLQDNGHTYLLERGGEVDPVDYLANGPSNQLRESTKPIRLSHVDSLRWVEDAIIRNRGRELQGDFNPLIIGELFWEQSIHWATIASSHMQDIMYICRQFLEDVLQDLCPADVKWRISQKLIEGSLKSRNEKAREELNRILSDLKDHPIDCNQSYVNTVNKWRLSREQQPHALNIAALAPPHGYNSAQSSVTMDNAQLYRESVQGRSLELTIDSCEKVIDGVVAIYEDYQKVFEANILIQVIERHIVRGIEDIFSPIQVSRWTDVEVNEIASEPASTRKERAYLKDRIARLSHGRGILDQAMWRPDL